MMRAAGAVFAYMCAIASGAARAEIGDSSAPDRAIGTDLFVSTDADKTDVIKTGVSFDWAFRDPERYAGIRLEKAWFKPQGGTTSGFERAYLRYADKSGGWAWQGMIGTDGHTVLGTVNIHDSAPFRKEFFVEREMLETPMGVKRGLYFTFVGAALDLPVDDRNNFTVIVGAQAFTGRNVRYHLRANYVHVVKPEWGLSIQLRTRYFRSSVPGEYDYFSPRWYAQLLPVVQLRRYSGGWRYSLAVGFGAQRDARSGWRSSRYANAEVTSPAVGRNLYVRASAVYSNTPVGSGYVYSYGQFSLALIRRF